MKKSKSESVLRGDIAQIEILVSYNFVKLRNGRNHSSIYNFIDLAGNLDHHVLGRISLLSTFSNGLNNLLLTASSFYIDWLPYIYLMDAHLFIEMSYDFTTNMLP